MPSQESSLIRQLPHGVTDLFFEHAAARIALERVLEDTFARWGYNRIIPPSFGYYETFATEASTQLQEEMYRFFDREGHVLALRPDMTLPTARLVGARLHDQTLPHRFYYIGSVFRYEEPQAGRQREFTQAGVELIGAGTPEADAEVLALTVAALEAMGMSDFQVNLGTVAYLKAILAGAKLTNGDLRRVERAIERRNEVELGSVLSELGISDDAARAIRAIPHLCGDEAVLQEAKRLATNAPAREAVERLARVYDLARLREVSEHLILDMAEVRSMGYYTGIAFHAYVAGLGFPVCSGGRYDGLIAHFGADVPAVGFALGVERAMLVTRPQVDISPDLVVRACEHPVCHAFVAEARSRGLRVEVDVLGRRDEALIAYGRVREARHIVCCRDATSYILADARASREVSRRELEEEMAQWNR